MGMGISSKSMHKSWRAYDNVFDDTEEEHIARLVKRKWCNDCRSQSCPVSMYMLDNAKKAVSPESAAVISSLVTYYNGDEPRPCKNPEFLG